MSPSRDRAGRELRKSFRSLEYKRGGARDRVGNPFGTGRGADVEEGEPLAYALCSRIRTALRILKRYRDRFPTFQEQANVALRYHCKEGNMKWVSLMLWAGADPYAPGAETYDTDIGDDYEGISALAFAALYRHYDVFKLRKVRLDPHHPGIRDVARYACDDEGFDLLKKLLEMGMDPNDKENGGCSI